MPSESKAQRRAMSIAEHHPEELYEKNKGLAKMSKDQLHDFATTKEKNLPEHKEPKRGMHSDKKHQHDTGRHKMPRGHSMKDY